MVEHRISRRQVVAALGAAGLTGLAGCSGGGGGSDGTDTEADDGTPTDTSMDDGTPMETSTPTPKDVSGTVKIGVLQPISGSLAYYGQQGIWGFASGLAYKGETDPFGPDQTKEGTQTISVGDVDYELYIRDTQFDPQTAQELATNLIQNEGVDMLYGGTSSQTATRLIDTVVKQTNIPYMAGPAASADITANSETCHERVFRASENTAMDARSGGKFVAQETDVSSVYLFGADYSFGHAVVSNYEAVLKAEGIEIVGKKFVPQGHSEWEGLLDNAEDAGADGIVTGFTVQTLPAIFTTYLNGDYSFRPFGGFATQITNNILGSTLQKVLGEPLTKQKLQDAQLGPFTTRYHWNQYDNEINNAFVDMYTDAYGVVPDLFTSGTFTAASAIVQAVNMAGSTEGDDIASALRGMTVRETPKGQGGYKFQKYNNQARSAMTVADLVPTSDEWADNWNAAVMPSEPVATVSKDEVTIPKNSDQMSCSL